MTTRGEHWPCPEITDLVAEWEHLDALLADLTNAEWEVASPCPGWSVHDVVSHILGTELLLEGDPAPEVDLASEDHGHVRNQIGELNELYVVAGRSRSHTELLADFRAIVARRQRTLAALTSEQLSASSVSPIGPIPYSAFMGIREFDCWVHEQDIRASTGRALRLDGPTSKRGLDVVIGSLPRAIAKRAGAPDGTRVRIALDNPAAPITDIVVADGLARIDDHSPESAHSDPAPHVTLRADTGTFVLVACGRISPASPEAAAIEPLGDVELGRRIIESLAFTM